MIGGARFTLVVAAASAAPTTTAPGPLTAARATATTLFIAGIAALSLTVLTGLVFGVTVIVIAWFRPPAFVVTRLRCRARIGLAAGVLATVAAVAIALITAGWAVAPLTGAIATGTTGTTLGASIATGTMCG